MTTIEALLPPVMQVTDRRLLQQAPLVHAPIDFDATYEPGARVELVRVHDLKLRQPHFEHVWEGRKRAELRVNDRNFRDGEGLWLREYVPVKLPDGSPHPDPNAWEYGNRVILGRITHVLDCSYVSSHHIGWVLLSLELQSRFTA